MKKNIIIIILIVAILGISFLVYQNYSRRITAVNFLTSRGVDVSRSGLVGLGQANAGRSGRESRRVTECVQIMIDCMMGGIDCSDESEGTIGEIYANLWSGTDSAGNVTNSNCNDVLGL